MIATAYKFMKYDKVKSIGVIIGIVISIFLIGNQTGILGFLTGLMGGLVGNARQEIGQIWVIDNITRNANELSKLDESLVREIRSTEGVRNTYPIVVSNASIKFPNGKISPIVMIGSEAPWFVAGPQPERIKEGELMSLSEDLAVSAEFFDQAQFDFPVKKGMRVEINGKSAIIKVQTKNARGFAGSFVYSTIEKVRYYTSFPVSKVSAIAVQVEPGYDAANVVSEINKTFYGIRAWKAEELKQSTINYITFTSNIGTSIGSLVVFAIISGFFIIGLTLYSSAVDRIRDYGTLKAIGASNRYITKLILMQSFLFALTGFLAAVILLEGFRTGVKNAGLIINYSAMEYLVLFLITVFISVGSALFFSVRTIKNVEPASVFRG
jgi:putative ABC transport system permease protein